MDKRSRVQEANKRALRNEKAIEKFIEKAKPENIILTLRKEAQKVFTHEYKRGHPIVHCCEIASIGRAQYINWRNEDEDFRQICEEIEQNKLDRLEQSAFKRAFSNTDLTKFMLRAHRPEVYQDRPVIGTERRLVIVCTEVPNDQVMSKIVEAETESNLTLVHNGNGNGHS